MSMVGGFDLHREQITFDCVDIETGEVATGRVQPANRVTLRAWLADHVTAAPNTTIAVEACTGWRYVVEELTAAGVRPVLAEPAETAERRGKTKKRAKTDRADARRLRELAVLGDLPACWLPPEHVLELRALLELYQDLHETARAWSQRIHACLFHQGAPALPAGALATTSGRARLAEVTAELSAAGQAMVATGMAVLEDIDAQSRPLHAEIVRRARRLRGARELRSRLYGVGWLTAAALVAWLGGADRFSSSTKAVRFAGLDVTVHASDAHRTPGHLSKQGPPVLRWLLFEAAGHGARAGSPDHAYCQQATQRLGGKRAALSQARRLTRRGCHILTDLGDDAFTTAPNHDRRAA